MRSLLKRTLELYFKDGKGNWCKHYGRTVEASREECELLDEIQKELQEEKRDSYEQFHCDE